MSGLADLALSPGLSPKEMAEQYALLVRYLRLLMAMLEERANSHSLPRQARKVAKACLDFFRILERYGYFDLNRF